MRKLLCKLFGWHRYKSGSIKVIIAGDYYLHSDNCCDCGEEIRFWFHKSAYGER
jgi:hypothetical protein